MSTFEFQKQFLLENKRIEELDDLLMFPCPRIVKEFIQDTDDFVVVFYAEPTLCQTFISDVLTFTRNATFETKYTITFALAPFSRFNTFLSTVEFYRNSRLLDGETLSWNSNMPFSKLSSRIQNSIARLTKLTISKDVHESDLDKVLDACGRGSDRADLHQLRSAIQSPTFNGNIDSYRQGCTERRGQMLQQVALATPLMFAMGPSNNLDVVKELVEELKCDINALCSQSYSALDYAFMWHNIEFVKYLITYGAHLPRALSEQTSSPFMKATIQHCRKINTSRQELSDSLQGSKLRVVSSVLVPFVYRPKVKIKA